jgi:hypothetical protein
VANRTAGRALPSARLGTFARKAAPASNDRSTQATDHAPGPGTARPAAGEDHRGDVCRSSQRKLRGRCAAGF